MPGNGSGRGAEGVAAPGSGMAPRPSCRHPRSVASLRQTRLRSEWPLARSEYARSQ